MYIRRTRKKKLPQSVLEAREKAVREALDTHAADGPIPLELPDGSRRFEVYRDYTVYEIKEVTYKRRLLVKDPATLALVAQEAQRTVTNMQRERERRVGIENRFALLKARGDAPA